MHSLWWTRAIEDFNKHLEGYEGWRHQLVESGAQYAIFNSLGVAANPGQRQDHHSILNVLPEFNMEKNMPVEDDENLAKKEEWWQTRHTRKFIELKTIVLCPRILNVATVQEVHYISPSK